MTLDRRNTSAPGQALEFELWAELIKQSEGALHIFLPWLDRGLDAVLHRLTDGRYIPIQVKGQSDPSRRFDSSTTSSVGLEAELEPETGLNS